MSQLLNHLPSKLCLGKPVLARSSPLCSNGCSSSLVQTPPCKIIAVIPCDFEFGQLVIHNANERVLTHTKKMKVPLELTDKDTTVMIGSSHGWVATLNLKDKGLRLIDDLNPVASDTDPKRILLPPLVTLPHCQTQTVTNVAMSSPSPEEEDCIVAVKFSGPQLSFCRPAQPNAQWINIKIEDPCFNSSRVMFSKKDDIFRIPGLGGNAVGSWDLRTHNHNPNIQNLRFQNLPELTETKQDLLFMCYTSEHLVESTTTGETFLIKWFRKRVKIDHIIPVLRIQGFQTQALMVFKLDEEGNAVYTQHIGDLCIFLSKSEPFCVPASSFPGMFPNHVTIYDVDEFGYVDLADCSFIGENAIFKVPYHIPPQNID